MTMSQKESRQATIFFFLLYVFVLFSRSNKSRTNNFVKQAEQIFKKLFGDNFKLNVYSMVFGPTHKIGNNASKLGIFLWSKIIKTIWICRKLLEESNEMEIF